MDAPSTTSPRVQEEESHSPSDKKKKESMESRWLYHSGYKELVGEQYDPAWFRESKGRLGCAKVSTVCNRSPFQTCEEYLLVFRGEKKEEFTEEQRTNMADGLASEPYARELYIRHYLQEGCKAREASMFVPDFNERLKYSPDLVITDDQDRPVGVAEFKCPRYMYRLFYQEDFLLDNAEEEDQEVPTIKRGGDQNAEESEAPEIISQRNDQGFIFDSHYDQMQMGMKILGVPWCDYLVYAHGEGTHRCRRVHFNPGHWEMLEKEIEKFFSRVNVSREEKKE